MRLLQIEDGGGFSLVEHLEEILHDMRSFHIHGEQTMKK
jgi:hypothetical protein